MIKRISCLALCVCLVLCIGIPVFAQESEPVLIATAEEFLAFSQNCRLDSYSWDLQVKLTADIDLTGLDFQGIPVFCGSFDGGGHTISGVNITCTGSELGLFRYLRSTATVSDLTVKGVVSPQGSRSRVGGIVGENAGKIVGCSFDGTVSGIDAVGGIAGFNAVTGVIEDCSVSGAFSGNHFVGGIAGENQGVIRGCENTAAVNTTPQQNTVELSDITLESLTGTESVITVTDIGGIAGISSGVIRDCENRGNIGYPHMGYNIGGIVGTQTGYLTACENYGEISGRKEVGGIVGQMEPVALIEYDADTLQILQGQLTELQKLTNQTSNHAEGSVSAISGQLEAVKNETQAAKDAVDSMLPDVEFPEKQLPDVNIPDKDTVLAAQGNLGSAISNIRGGMQSILTATENTVDTLYGDLQAITDQVNTIGKTLQSGTENLGGSITDMSDSDTDQDTTGKTELSTNYGAVLGDRNVGGIVGGMSIENDLDPEDDLSFAGESSLNFQGSLRVVVVNCENKGSVTAKKQNAGGVTGWQWLGLIKNCVNTGSISCDDGDYVGGIVGRSSGFVRGCSTKCELNGGSYVGGIVGTGTTVTDCRSMVQISAAERVGGILGFAESRENILRNICMPVGADIGGIDGINYEGCAQSLPTEAFLKMENLPEMFRTVTASFCFDDGTVQTVLIALGEALTQADIPQLPEEPGKVAYWEGLDDQGLSFDTVYRVAYRTLSTAIQSEQTRENGRPVFLLEGTLSPGEDLSVTASEITPDIPEGAAVVESWAVNIKQAAVAHYLPPAQYDLHKISLFVLTADGTWEQTALTQDGSYLVFSMDAGAEGFCLVENAPDYTWLYIAIGAAVVAVIGSIAAVVVHKKRKKAQPAQTQI